MEYSINDKKIEVQRMCLPEGPAVCGTGFQEKGTDMNKIQRIAAAAAAFLLLFTVNGFAAVIAARPFVSGTGELLCRDEPAEEFASVPEDAALFVLVEAEGSGGTLTVYAKGSSVQNIGPGGKQEAGSCGMTPVLTASCHLGANGTGKEQEGDKKTPLGLFSLNTPFGILDPEEGFPENYHKVTEYDYWTGSRQSANRNRLADIREFPDTDRAGAEHLIAYPGYYDHALNISYNAEGEYGKGSAIFLHCSPYGESTGGCIATDRETIRAVLKLYREGKSYIRIRNKA